MNRLKIIIVRNVINIIKIFVIIIVIALGFYLIFGPGFTPFDPERDDEAAEELVSLVQNGEIISAMEIVDILADPEFMGRKTGSRGYEMAAMFVEGIYRELELTPIIEIEDQKTYRQNYNQPYNQLKGPYEFSLIDHAGREITPPIGEKYVFDPSSNKGDVKAKMVFVGYGVKNEETGYDDFEGVCLEDKIATALFRLPKDFPLDAYRDRAENIATEGAASLIYIVEDEEKRLKEAIFSRWWGSSEPGSIPVLWVDEDIGNEMLKPSTFKVNEWKEDFDLRKRPRSFPLEYKARIKINNIRREEAKGINLVGEKNYSSDYPYVLLTAHLDTPGISITGEQIPGANDNASGVGVILETISRIKKEDREYPFNIMLAVFGGEEDGLKGSRHFVENLPVESSKIDEVINIDMIGAGSDKIMAETDRRYSASNRLHTALTNLSRQKENFEYKETKPSPRSDHWPFVTNNYSALHLYRPLQTADNSDISDVDVNKEGLYHTPQDKPDTVSERHLSDAVEVVLSLLDDLADNQ